MPTCSSEGSWGSTKAWIVHGVVAGAAVAAAIGARFYLGRVAKFRSRVVGIIPARFASSRFQGKPLAHILGKPMIQVPKISSLICLPILGNLITFPQQKRKHNLDSIYLRSNGRPFFYTVKPIIMII